MVTSRPQVARHRAVRAYTPRRYQPPPEEEGWGIDRWVLGFAQILAIVSSSVVWG